MRIYSWLIRRELWEYRAIWILPIVIGVALSLAALFGKVELGTSVSTDPSRAIGGTVLFAFSVVFFLVTNVYSTWYLLDCLYADRKDKSVLFWKSLPVSDTATVLAKLATGLFAIPLVYFMVADLSTLLIAFIVSMRARAWFGSALWQPGIWLQLQALWLYLIVTTAVWYLPFAGYCLVISSWAKRAVALWSLLPIAAAYALENWFLGTNRFGALLYERSAGYFAAAFRDVPDRADWIATSIGDRSISAPAHLWRLLDPVGFLSLPETWAGLGVGIAFIVAAVQLRLRKCEM